MFNVLLFILPIVNKSDEKANTIDRSTSRSVKVWYVFCLCATELHCCWKAIKNTPTGHNLSLSWTHTLQFILARSHTVLLPQILQMCIDLQLKIVPNKQQLHVFVMFDEKIFFVYYWGFSKNENKHTWFLIKHFQFSVLRVSLIFVDKVEGYRMSECDLWPKKEEIQKEITNIGLYPQNSVISWGILWNRMKTITESHVNEILCCLLQALPAVKYKPRHHTEDYSAQPSHLKLLIRKTCECLLVCNLMTCCYRFSCSRNEVSDLDRSPLKAHVNWVEAVGRYKLGGLLSAVTSHLIIFPLPARIKTMCRSWDRRTSQTQITHSRHCI